MSTIRTRSMRIGIGAAVALALATGAAVLAKPETALAHEHSKCPHHFGHRTAKQTIEEHISLMQAGKMDEALCDYAEDAVVIMPGQTIRGREEIGNGLLGFMSLLGGAIPQVKTLTATDSIVMITFSAVGTPCTIPDGSDTYIVEKGRIVAQTVHDTVYSAAGAICPLAAPGN